MPCSDLETVKGACALHCRSVFGLMILAGNIGLRPHQLENWLKGTAELPPEAMAQLVTELFQGRAQWDPERGELVDVDVVEPATAVNLPSP